jgi:hypothetical protein
MCFNDLTANEADGIGHALVIPAFSFSMTWLIVKLAGLCDGGNSIND